MGPAETEPPVGQWTEAPTPAGLTVQLPEKAPGEHAFTLRIKGLLG